MTYKVFREFSVWRGVWIWPGFAAAGLAVLLGVLLVWLPLQTSVLLVAGTAVVLLTIIQPLFGLALALIAGPFGALEQLLLGSSSLDSGQLLLFLTLAAWIGRGLARRKITLPHTVLTLPFLLLISVGLLSLLGARSMELGIRELLKWLEMMAIVFLVVDLGSEGTVGKHGEARYSILGGPPKTAWIVAMLLAAGISQGLVGIWQFALRGDGPEHFLVMDRFYRAYGTFEQPNPFGGFMNLSALLALGLLLGLLGAWWAWWRAGEWVSGERRVASGRDELKYAPPLAEQSSFRPGFRALVVTGLAALAAGITTLALLLSWSRGAWLGFAAGLAAMVLFWPHKRIHGALLLGSGFLLFAIALASGRVPAAVTARLTGFTDDFRPGDVHGVDINDDNYSVLERQAHWQAGLDMLRDDILLGVGFGNYAVAYPDYALINWPDPLGHAHNYYINLLAEVGIIGLIAYLIFWSAVLWQSARLLRHLDWPGRGIVLGLLGVWVALAAHHLVDKLYVNNIYIHLGVLLGLLQLMDLDKSSNRRGTLTQSRTPPVEESG